MSRWCAALLLLAAIPAASNAQTTPSPLVRADVSASLGWFSGRHQASYGCCQWSSGLFKGLQGGFYWTDHVKTELEVSATGETEAYTFFPTNPAPTTSTSYVSAHHVYRDVLVSGGQFYQFGRNAYFHPFVGAGLDVDREHDVVEQRTTTGVSTTVATSTDIRVRAHPYIAGGFKAYCSERIFFRTDLKAGYDGGFAQMTWRLGFGIDF